MTTILLAALLAAPPTEADGLFRQARDLMKTRPVEACPKFERSFELDPALGTLLNLALCLEETNQLASAWVRFNQAVEWASRTHEADRERMARQHTDAIKPRLSWLAIVPAKVVPGLEVEINGQRVGLSGLLSVPVNKGVVLLRVSAPGFTRWESQFEAPEAGGTLRVSVPALEAENTAVEVAPVRETLPMTPIALEPVEPRVTQQPEPPPSRAPGALLVGLGATVIGASVVGLIYSLGVNARAQPQHMTQEVTGEPVVSRDELVTAGLVYVLSWVGVGVGALTAGIGSWLLLRPPPVKVSGAIVPGRGGALSVSISF